MGRYSEYFKEIWKLQANRKVMGIGIFGVLVDNSRPFTPGDMLKPLDGVDVAIRNIVQKGYDFIIITGQPPSRTKNLDNQDFENIISGAADFITQLGGRVRNVYYAPGLDKSDPYVKPNAGMLERAQKENNFSWEDTFFVGAEPNDAKAAVKVKAVPVIVGAQESKMKAFEMSNHIKVRTHSTLLDFSNNL